MTDSLTETAPSGRKIRKSLRVSILANSIGMFWFATALGVPLTMLLEVLGASGVLIGLAMTSQQVSMFFQLIGAYMANRINSRKQVWLLFSLPQRLLWIMVPVVLLFAQDATVLWLILIVAVSAILGNLNTPPWIAWMADLVPPRENGKFWGKRQAYTTLIFLAATMISGWLLDLPTSNAMPGGAYFFFILVFAIAALSGLLDTLFHIRVPEFGVSETRIEKPFSLLARMFKERNFMLVTISFGLWGISMSVMNPFVAIYLRRAFDATYTQLSLLTVMFSVGAIIAGLFWGKAMDTIGARTFGSLMLLAVPFLSIPWFLVSDQHYNIPLIGETPEAILLYLGVSLLTGAFFSGISLCQINVITTMAGIESRTLTQALHFTLAGLMGAIGPLLGGRLMDVFGLQVGDILLPRGVPFSFFHIQLLIHIGLALVAVLVFHKTAPTLADVPVRHLLGSPLRTLSIIQNLMAISTPRNEKARARAIEKLMRRTQGEFTIEALERALNEDPSPKVRAKAIDALGRIKHDAVIDILTRYYETYHERDLYPELARSLGESHSDKAAPILLELLDMSGAAQMAAIESLGNIGNEWARQPLINLLQHSKDTETVQAAGSALVKITQRQNSEAGKKVKQAAKLVDANREVAVNELVNALNYPSSDVQQLTLKALSGIQDNALVHDLLNRLEQSNRSIKPKVAQALAKSNKPGGINMLIDSLGAGDPQTQIESARSLGKMGDKRASHALLEVLRTSQDEDVISASSDALVHLREIAAFYDIIPQMKTTKNPLLKRTLAVAAGNLLGKSGSFYSFLIQEENLPGAQISRRLDQVNRRITRLCTRQLKSAAPPLIAALNALESDIDSERWEQAAERLFELSFGLAAVAYGIEHDEAEAVFIEKLIWHDEHAGVCTWFLYMITHDWNNPAYGAPTRLDVMLGLYFLSEWDGYHQATRQSGEATQIIQSRLNSSIERPTSS